MRLPSTLLTLLFFFPILPTLACETDEDCSLNGLCKPTTTPPYPQPQPQPQPQTTTTPRSCVCDPGWYGPDCGHLDLRPARAHAGYQHIADAQNISSYYGPHGNSSWGGQILQDRTNPQIFHLFVSQFAKGCGLSGWRPHSMIVRAESRSGPQGPYYYAETVGRGGGGGEGEEKEEVEGGGRFRHNVDVIWSPFDSQYLLYATGATWHPSSEEAEERKCSSIPLTQWPNNISVASAPTPYGPWSDFTLVLASKTPHSTNPTAFPLYSPANPTREIVLGVEDNALYLASDWRSSANYTLVHEQTAWNTSQYSPTWTEDPFLWRDARGNWHSLNHWMIDIVEHDARKWPRVGVHIFARNLTGPWHFTPHEAFNSTVIFGDGEEVTFGRRERAKLFFGDVGDGMGMRPLYLTSGVQEQGETGKSWTLVQPVGEEWRRFEEGLGFRD